jgi:hypothetical protein
MAYYGTNSQINVYGSLAQFIEDCPSIPDIPKFFDLESPTYRGERQDSPHHLVYYFQMLPATGYEQGTRCHFYAVASVIHENELKLYKSWTQRIIDRLRRYFLESPIPLLNFEELCSESLWDTFLNTGNFAPLITGMEGVPQQISDIMFHPKLLGTPTPSSTPSTVETSWQIELAHLAVDNISPLNSSP